MRTTSRLARRSALLLAIPALLLTSALAPAAPAAAADTVWRSVPLDGGAVGGLGSGRLDDGSTAVWAVTDQAGVFRTLDEGRTWTRLRTAPGTRAQLPGVDPRNGDRAFVVFLDLAPPHAGPSGLFFTTDGGATWTRSFQGLGGNSTYVYQVAFDPEDSGVVYAATLKGLFRSENGGRTWARLAFTESIFAVGVAPGDPRILLVSTLSGVHRSVDGGATFDKVLGSGLYNGFVFDPSEPGRVYGTSGPLFRSDDNGATWVQVARQLLPNFTSLAVTGDGTLYVGSREGTFRSTDAGVTFTPRTTPSLDARRPDDEVADLAPLADGGVLAAGVRGVWRLDDEKSGWKAASRGIRAHDVVGLAVTGAGRLLVSVPFNAIFLSDDGVRFRATTRGLRDPYGLPGLELVSAPSDPEVVYGSTSYKFFRSDNGGAAWRPLAVPNPGQNVRILAVHPENPDILYAGGDEYHPREDYGKCLAARSRDGGESWDCLSGPDLFELRELVIDPRPPHRLLGLAYSRFVISDDEGETWRQAGRGLPDSSTGYPLTALSLDSRGRVLVGTFEGGLWRSTDGGASFTRVGRGLPRVTIQQLIADPRRPDTVYALLEAQGVFRSRDGGRQWERLGRGLPARLLTGTAVLDDERGFLYVGTRGRGLFRLDVR